MDSGIDALPGCPHCGGKGSKALVRPDGSFDYRICPCVILGQRRRVADALMLKLFPGRNGQMTFSTFQTGGHRENEVALQVARNFVDDWETAQQNGWTLGFWGKPRAGKTHLATAIAISLLKRYLVRPMVTSVPELLRAERQLMNVPSYERGGTASPIDRAAQADLLVLDDLGAEYMRSRSDARSAVDWVDEQLYLILNERVMRSRPTVYTTNCTPSELKRLLSERVWSRIDRSEVVPAVEMLEVAGAGRASNDDRDRLLRGTSLEGAA